MKQKVVNWFLELIDYYLHHQMQPGKNEFYNAVDRLRKGKEVAENERDCYKAKCMELHDENTLLNKMVRTSEDQNAALHNILRHQSKKYNAVKDDRDIRTEKLNKKIEENILLQDKVKELEAKLEQSKNNYPPSNARVVELKILKDGHKTDIG